MAGCSNQMLGALCAMQHTTCARLLPSDVVVDTALPPVLTEQNNCQSGWFLYVDLAAAHHTILSFRQPNVLNWQLCLLGSLPTTIQAFYYLFSFLSLVGGVIQITLSVMQDGSLCSFKWSISQIQNVQNYIWVNVLNRFRCLCKTFQPPKMVFLNFISTCFLVTVVPKLG